MAVKNVTIVMYHYVRDLQRSRYPGIKGLDIKFFKEQLAYIKKHYNVISPFDLMEAVQSQSLSCLPSMPLLMTFDDGYIDHFTEVFPVLVKEKLSACFFPSAGCVAGDRVLDVNKIHFVLASVPDKRLLVEFVFQTLDEFRSELQLESNDFYWRKCGIGGRFDSAEIMFVKYMLQRDLPPELRSLILNRLFGKFVTQDEGAFSRELYMSIDQVACLQTYGMCVGSHGYDHLWLNAISEVEQRRQIDLSLEFLSQVGVDLRRWMMCYPYGGYDDSLLSILKSRNCCIGLTTEVGVADLSQNSPLVLPRLDTNDLPKDANSEPCDWTLGCAAS